MRWKLPFCLLLAATAQLGLAPQSVAQTVPTDLFLVFDETGSIDSSEFFLQKNFMLSLVPSTLFSDGGRAGVVLFAGTARVAVPLTSSYAQFQNAVSALTRLGTGGTCIGCGLSAAQAQLDALSSPERLRKMLVLTDGANNVDPAGQTLAQIAQAVQDAATAVSAVGVGSAYSAAELQLVASDPDAEHVFSASTFSGLAGLVDPVSLALFDSPYDIDEDGILDAYDNCPGLANPSQSDVELDGVGDDCDNCPDTRNHDQADSGGSLGAVSDGIGDACQRGDIDGDGDLDIVDDVLFRRGLTGLEPEFPPRIPASP